MAILHLEVKYFKIQHAPIFNCPNPQYNTQCSGKFIKTRRWQHECEACLKLHNTIDKHPLLNKIRPKYHLTDETYVVEEYVDPYQRRLAYWS